MLIGIISDTHDHRSNFAKAIALFKKMHVNIIVHAGDFCSPFTQLDWPSEPWCKLIGVFGNNDGDRVALSKAWSRGAQLKKEEEIINTDAGFLYLHHQPAPAEAALVSGRYQFVVHGHTHRWEEKKHGNCLLVNPGECCGWLTGVATVALLDTIARSILRLELAKTP